MALVQGQFAFVGEILLTTGAEAPRDFVDLTNRALPGLLHVGIDHSNDGEGIVI
jgi:hypothetical protein